MLILSVMHENMTISLDPVEVEDALSIVMYLLWCTCTLYCGELALSMPHCTCAFGNILRWHISIRCVLDTMSKHECQQINNHIFYVHKRTSNKKTWLQCAVTCCMHRHTYRGRAEHVCSTAAPGSTAPTWRQGAL